MQISEIQTVIENIEKKALLYEYKHFMRLLDATLDILTIVLIKRNG